MYNAAIDSLAESSAPAERQGVLERKVPVPQAYALCEDESVVGSAFYVMEFVKGRIFEDTEMWELESKEERRQWWVGRRLGRTLSLTLHC